MDRLESIQRELYDGASYSEMWRRSLDNKAISQGVRQNREQVTANPWGEIHPSGSLQYIAYKMRTAPVFYSV